MGISGRSNLIDKKKLLTFLLAGMAAGILVLLFGRSVWLGEKGLFCREILAEIKEESFDYGDLFWYVLKRRFLLFGLIVLLCNTVFSEIIPVLCIIASGVPMGMMLAALSLRYGLKGILLAAAWLFPHFLFYALAFLLLVVQFGQQGFRDCCGGGNLRRDRLLLVVIILIILAGVLLESFLNPRIIKVILILF